MVDYRAEAAGKPVKNVPEAHAADGKLLFRFGNLNPALFLRCGDGRRHGAVAQKELIMPQYVSRLCQQEILFLAVDDPQQAFSLFRQARCERNQRGLVRRNIQTGE